MKKSCEVFIDYAQGFKPSLPRSHFGRHIDFRTEGSILNFALQKYDARAASTVLTGVTRPETWTARLNRLDTISAEPLFLALWSVLERLYSQGRWTHNREEVFTT